MNPKHIVKKSPPKTAVVKHQGTKHPARRDTGKAPIWLNEFREPLAMTRDMDRLFEEMSEGSGLLPTWWRPEPLVRLIPQMEMQETPQDIRITAELPGVEKKDLEVTLDGDTLRLRGETKTEHKEKGRKSYRFEQSFGSFERVIPLPVPVDARKADAHIKKGVLTITLPKTESARSHERKIEIKAA